MIGLGIAIGFLTEGLWIGGAGGLGSARFGRRWGFGG